MTGAGKPWSAQNLGKSSSQPERVGVPSWPMSFAIRLLPVAVGWRASVSASCSSLSHIELSALLTARLSARSFSRGDMSRSVRAGVVTLIPSWVVMSRRRSVVLRWMRMPLARRSPTTVTSNGLSHWRQ